MFSRSSEVTFICDPGVTNPTFVVNGEDPPGTPQYVSITDQGSELQCLLKVKEDLSLVLIFQHVILNAK